MKNQTDMIVTIVAVLCMLIGVGVCFGTKREAVKPAPPEAVVSTPLQLPAGDVVMAASLPGPGGAGGGGGGGGRGGFGGGGRGGFGGGGGRAGFSASGGGGAPPLTAASPSGGVNAGR